MSKHIEKRRHSLVTLPRPHQFQGRKSQVENFPREDTVRSFFARYAMVSAIVIFGAVICLPSKATETEFRLNQDEQERVIHAPDELPPLWLDEIRHSKHCDRLEAALNDGNVKVLRFHGNQNLLTIECQGHWPSTEIYFGHGRFIERLHFAKPEPDGGLGIINHLWLVEVDAKNERLTSKFCSDVLSDGCGRSIYKFNGVYFVLEKIEAQKNFNAPWLPVWTATKIILPK